MIPAKLDDLSGDALVRLLGQLLESRTLEFKREFARTDAGRKSLVKAVTALANTAGGDLVIGVDEKGGSVSGIPGIETDDPDGYILRESERLRTGVEPPLPPFDFRPYQVAEGKWIFVLRVLRSWVGPHRSLIDKEFYVRAPGQSIALSVPELRTAFGLRDSGADRIDAFRRDRLARLFAGDTPVPLVKGAVAVLHLASLSVFIERAPVDIVNMHRRGTHMPLPLGAQGRDASVNLHGVCNSRPLGAEGSHGYGHAFRNGAYETVQVRDRGGDQEPPIFIADTLARDIMNAVRYGLSFYKAYDLPHPIVVMFSIVDGGDARLRVPALEGGYFDRGPTGEDVIAFPEVLIEREDADVAASIRPILDMLYNAFGQMGCTLYDGQGNWIGG